MHSKIVEIKKPREFNLYPNQIRESNYNYWVKEYGATDVEPPPEVYITKSINLHSEENESSYQYSNSEELEKEESLFSYSRSAEISIDEGYRAVHATVNCLRRTWMSYSSVDIALGLKTTHLSAGDKQWSISLNGETGSIPFAIQGNWVSRWAAVVEVRCQKTERGHRKWHLETLARLT